MDLIQSIRLCRRVAELSSFSLAANEFGMGQPTVSKTIAGLENYVGVTLFRRSTKGLTLTEEGEHFLRWSDVMLNHWDEGLEVLRNPEGLLQGSLKVACSHAFVRLILTPLLPEFCDIHPNLRLNFTLGDGYVDLVEQGIDIAIRIGNLPDSSLRAIKLGSCRRFHYATPNYLARFGAPQVPDDLHQHRLLYYNRINKAPEWPLNQLNGEPLAFAFSPFIQSDAADLIREALLNHMGITFMPSWSAVGLEESGQVVKLLQAYSVQAIPVYAVFVGTRSITKKQRALVDFLKLKFANCAELNYSSPE